MSPDGGTLVMGEPYDDDSGTNAGAVLFQRYDGAVLVDRDTVLASNGAAGDRFGISVATSGDVAVVGASGVDGFETDDGAAYVYRYEGSHWIEEAILTASDHDWHDEFGAAVAMSGDVAVIGAPYDDDTAGDAGSAYVFRYDGAAWIEEAKLLASDGASDDAFGLTLAIEGDVILVGAVERDDLYPGSGAVYVFRRVGSAWVEQPKLIPLSDGAVYDLGKSFGISGGRAIVGAYPHLQGTYVFDAVDPVGRDCNANGICDAVDIHDGTSTDCNGNGAPDECDIGIGYSADCNGNGLPDECEHDCNLDGVPDVCVADCNLDGVPDDCEFTYALDDGSAETAIGSGNDLREWIELNQFVVTPGDEEIVAIGINWWNNEDGIPTTLLVYGDPNNDGDPSDAVLLRAAAVESADTAPDQVARIPIEPVVVGRAGDSFFVGAAITATAWSRWPLSLDESSPYQARSWIAAGYIGQPVDIEHLDANPSGIRLMSEACCGGACPGNWLIRAWSSAQFPCGCAPDLDGSGEVGAPDLGAVIAAWGPCNPCPEDIDHSGEVGFRDLLLVLAAWGQCP